MKKNLKNIYLIEFILLIFLSTFKMFILNKIPGYATLINGIFWVFLLIFIYIIFGFARDKNFFNRNSIRIVIVSFLLYILVSYMLGMFTGLYKNNLDLIQFLKNVVPLGIIYILVELSRYMIFKKDISKLHIVIITILLIGLDVLIEINGIRIDTSKRLFIVLSTIIIPIIARESLYSYMTYNIGYKPTILLRLLLLIYPYVLPMLPNLSNYLISVIEVLLPFIIFIQVNKSLRYKEKYGIYGKKVLRYTLITITLVFVITLAMLTSGLFKYKLVAIMSGSMEPAYYRGDAIIVTSKDASDIKEGEVLAFNVGNGIITHRVVEIHQNGKTYTFITKGDNNDTNDIFEIHNEHVIGTVDYVLKYVGYPTVWINELFSRR